MTDASIIITQTNEASIDKFSDKLRKVVGDWRPGNSGVLDLSTVPALGVMLAEIIACVRVLDEKQAERLADNITGLMKAETDLDEYQDRAIELRW